MNQQGNVFARMIRAGSRRVASVIGGDENVFVLFKCIHKTPEPFVKLHQRRRISRRIVAMSVAHVKINQVGEYQVAFILAAQPVNDGHAPGIVRGVMVLLQAAAAEYLGDLPNPACPETGIRKIVEYQSIRRLQGEILPLIRSRKIARPADKRPGDDAGDAVLTTQKLPGNPAAFVKLRKRDNVVVRGDLKHAVGGCIDDQFACLKLTRSQFFDNLGARSGPVTDDTPFTLTAEFIDEFVGKTIRVCWKRRGGHKAHELPVAGEGIFPGRLLLQPGDTGGVCFRDRQTVDTFGGTEAQGRQRGKLNTRFGDNMPQCMSVLVAIFSGVRGCADTETVKNNEYDAGRRSLQVQCTPTLTS